MTEAGDESPLCDVTAFGPEHRWSPEDDLTGVKGVAASAFGRTFCDPVTLPGHLSGCCSSRE